MNKSQLAQIITDKVGLSKDDGNQVVQVFLETITDALKKGDNVALIGFGTFSVVQRAARTGINPRNPTEKIDIPSKIVTLAAKL